MNVRVLFEPGTFGVGICVYTEPLGFEIFMAWWVLHVCAREKETE